jgi:2-keto-3-deoxy-L-fuconate dehydrogenase
MLSLSGKTAFVTAAGQGIGRATARAFAAAGAHVIATDLDAAKLADLASDQIRIDRLDVLDQAAIAHAARSDRHPVQLRRRGASGHGAGGE